MFISYYVNFQLRVRVCQICAFLDFFDNNKNSLFFVSLGNDNNDVLPNSSLSFKINIVISLF